MQQNNFKSQIIKNLPPYFQKEKSFLDYFLIAFEDILIKNPGSEEESRASLQSIDYIINNIHKYFDPMTTPPQFIDWLANWVGFETKKGEEYNHEYDTIEQEYESPLKQHIPLLSEDDRASYNRLIISEFVRRYQTRGTYTGVQYFINFFVREMKYSINYGDDESITIPTYDEENEINIISVRIDEYLKPFTLGKSSRIGRNTVLGESRPYYFSVRFTFAKEHMHSGLNLDLSEDEFIVVYERFKSRVLEDIMDILEEEKPGHVYYYYDVIEI